MSDRRWEVRWIYLTHGPADAITTIAARRSVGVEAELNPIVRSLLEIGDVPTTVVMCCWALIASAAWPLAADAIDAPPIIGYVIGAIGAIVAGINLLVAL